MNGSYHQFFKWSKSYIYEYRHIDHIHSKKSYGLAAGSTVYFLDITFIMGGSTIIVQRKTEYAHVLRII